MSNKFKRNFLHELNSRFGRTRKLSNSLSLFEVPDYNTRVYIRYSKVHGRSKSLYGLRSEDLKQLEGLNSFICFIWDTQTEPLFIPFSEFEDIFQELIPASDGQYKVLIFHQTDQHELYIANAGKFNVESYFGWKYLESRVNLTERTDIPDFTHSQVQTLIGSIGNIKGFDVWIPPIDRSRLDWNMTSEFKCIAELPSRYEKINGIIREIDVIWVKRGSSDLLAMFEVEHSTPIYSGLLRFNDLYLVEPHLKARFSIISNDLRKGLFLKQINRPTFQSSGLTQLCNFLEYKDVYSWFGRTKN
ncbi:MAG: hypothetical protein OXH57_08400 [Ekhidna sp.]|nr:hypothetical protein [Ekhidna sp.]